LGFSLFLTVNCCNSPHIDGISQFRSEKDGIVSGDDDEVDDDNDNEPQLPDFTPPPPPLPESSSSEESLREMSDASEESVNFLDVVGAKHGLYDSSAVPLNTLVAAKNLATAATSPEKANIMLPVEELEEVAEHADDEADLEEDKSAREEIRKTTSTKKDNQKKKSNIKTDNLPRPNSNQDSLPKKKKNKKKKREDLTPPPVSLPVSTSELSNEQLENVPQWKRILMKDF
jgi:hypothetical protein